MKKNTFIFRLALLIIPILGLFLFTSYSSGAPDGYSGSPGDGGNYCSACHLGTNNNYNNQSTISSNIPAEGYTPGQTYTITVTPNSTAPKHGFEITAENSSNTKVGEFLSTATTTYPGTAHTALTHNAPITSGVWSFDWVAPSTTEGTITFYAAINAVNGDGAAYDNQDEPITTSLTVNQTAAGVANLENTFFSLAENPVRDFIMVNFNQELSGTYSIYDIAGKKIQEADFKNKNELTINSNTLKIGMYILKITSTDLAQNVQFIKH